MGPEEASKARRRGGAYRLRTEARAVHPIVRELTIERQRQDLSQTELARRMGLTTYQQVYSLETGRTSPTLRTLDRWTAALGRSLTLGERGTDGAS